MFFAYGILAIGVLVFMVVAGLALGFWLIVRLIRFFRK